MGLADPEIPNGTHVERILYEGEELHFKSAEIQDVGGDEVADYRLSISVGSRGTHQFNEVQRKNPKPRVTIETSSGETYGPRMVIGAIGMTSSGKSKIEAHLEFGD